VEVATTLRDVFYFDNHTLTINGFTITDQDVVSFLRDFESQRRIFFSV
jgi:hypothetical protein